MLASSAFIHWPSPQYSFIVVKLVCLRHGLTIQPRLVWNSLGVPGELSTYGPTEIIGNRETSHLHIYSKILENNFIFLTCWFGLPKYLAEPFSGLSAELPLPLSLTLQTRKQTRGRRRRSFNKPVATLLVCFSFWVCLSLSPTATRTGETAHWLRVSAAPTEEASQALLPTTTGGWCWKSILVLWKNAPLQSDPCLNTFPSWQCCFRRNSGTFKRWGPDWQKWATEGRPWNNQLP